MTNELHYLKRSHELHFLTWKNADFELYHKFCKVSGFDQYNYLIEFNYHVEPDDYDPIVDRTQTVKLPYRYAVDRAWHEPLTTMTLDQVLETRAKEYLQFDQTVNIFWSGGIDSTAILVAFLTCGAYKDQLRVVYTDSSVNEHPDFFKHLQDLGVQLYKLTLRRAITDKLDGVIVDGLTCDERSAEIGQKQFMRLGGAVLYQPWQKYFVSCNVSPGFFDFFDQWFAVCARPIKTLLDARWWFYLQTKSQSHKYTRPRFYTRLFDWPEKINHCFFDCNSYDDYVYNNLEKFMPSNCTYHGYKQCLKDYIKKYDGNQVYHNNAMKINSFTLQNLGLYVDNLLDQNWSLLLANGTYHGVPSLPLISVDELQRTFQSDLDDIFNF